MRTGAYTIHQSLTAEAAAVLKLSLGLARRRGHAQVTPLHLAFTLLSSSCASPLVAFSSPSSATAGAVYGLLKRACLRSHPAAPPASHPLQCRTLELCFNVALNRLPTSAPQSSPESSGPSSTAFSSSLIQPNPTLSNALVAALKRAQANQRRGCVELQQQQRHPSEPHQPPPPQQHGSPPSQQQPLLAIKVELDQLIISILDDPSVSRVMREAGFSSATVKSSLEEESAMLASSSPPPAANPPHFFLDYNNVGNSGGGGFWPAQFLAAPGIPLPSSKEDVRAVIEVMVRKQGRRSNPVVVGDLVSMAEAVAGELMKRLERGEVPEELARAHLLKLNLSYVHVRLMSHADVEAKAAELRRSVDAVPRSSLVVYVGDLRWAVEEDRGMGETGASYSPVEHMVVELGRLLGELRADAAATGRGRVWLVATASYQTYMRCQQRRTTSLEAMWGLQAVVVPTGSTTGLALNLHASSPSSATPSNYRMAKLAQSPSKHAEPMAMAACREDHEAKLVLCTECSKNYESEASAVKKAEAEATCISNLPAWLLPEKPETPHKDKYLIDLKRKWSRLCQRLHFHSNHTNPSFAPYFGSSLHASSDPWWSSCLANSQCKRSIGGFLSFESLMEHGKSKNQWSPPPPPPHVSLSSPGEPASQDVTTTLVLGRFLVSVNDSATSEGFSPNSNGSANVTEELEQRLNENIPWQSNAVRAIAEAVTACRSDEKEKKGVWLFMKGNDHVAVRRAAIVIAEIRCGSANKMICVDPKRFRSREGFCSDVFAKASKIGSKKLVLLVEDIEQAPQDVVDALAAAVKNGFLKDQFAQELDLSNSIIIFTTSNFAKNIINVINLRLYSDELPSDDLKRKVKIELSRECKRMRDGIGCASLDLNLCTVEEDKNEDDDDDDAIPSDITHEGSNGEPGEIHNLISFIATRVIAFDGDHREAASTIRSRLARAVMNQGLRIDEEVVGMLAVASGWFLEKVWERWVAEVFEPAAALAATVKNGGKVVRVGLGEMGFVGGEEDDSEAMAQIGFMGSVLPRRIHVD